MLVYSKSADSDVNYSILIIRMIVGLWVEFFLRRYFIYSHRLDLLCQVNCYYKMKDVVKVVI